MKRDYASLSCDKHHYRRPQFLIQLSNYTLQRTLKHPTNITAVPTIATIVTRRFEQQKQRSNSAVFHRNLHVIKPMRECLKSTKQLSLFLNCPSGKNEVLSKNEMVISYNIDILAITQTGHDLITKSEGVTVLFEERLDVAVIHSSKNDIFTHFEHMKYSVNAFSPIGR